MESEQTSRTKIAGLVLAGILSASVGVAAGGLLPIRQGTTEGGMSERGRAVWAERLSRQAEAHRQERSDSAYSARLRMMARARVNAAYADRLNGLAEARGLRGMSDRAEQAWTDRLNGLADR